MPDGQADFIRWLLSEVQVGSDLRTFDASDVRQAPVLADMLSRWAQTRFGINPADVLVSRIDYTPSGPHPVLTVRMPPDDGPINVTVSRWTPDA